MTVSVVRAKFRCTSKTLDASGQTRIEMNAVYSEKPGSVNKAFSDATPAGHFVMHIAPGKPVADLFDAGKDYHFDITEAPTE